MSARALEFVETWVSEKIEKMETLPAEGDEATPKAWANECLQAALDEDIPAAEIQEAFDDPRISAYRPTTETIMED